MRVAAAEEGIEFIQSSDPPKDKTLWLDEETFIISIDNIFGR